MKSDWLPLSNGLEAFGLNMDALLQHTVKEHHLVEISYLLDIFEVLNIHNSQAYFIDLSCHILVFESAGSNYFQL